MKQTNTHGRLESVAFEITAGDIFMLLHGAGKIPEGFAFDYQRTADDWPDEPLTLHVRRYTPEQSTTPDAGGEHG